VRDILKKKTYAGYACIGGGQDGRLRAKEAHNRFGYHEKSGAVPAIVSFEDWKTAVAKIKKNKDEQRTVHPTRSSPLSGIMYCGHCNYAMDKHSRADRDGTRYAYFSCSSAIKRPGKRCHQWRVREDEILPFVIEHLVEEVDRAILEQSNAKPDQDNTGDELAEKKAQLAALLKKRDQSEQDWLGLPPSAMKDRLMLRIKELHEQEEELERQIQNLTLTQGDVTKFAQWWNSIRNELVAVLPVKAIVHDMRPMDHVIEKWSREETTAVEASENEPVEGLSYKIARQEKQPEHIEVLDKGVVMESSRFRNLVKTLGVKAVCEWEAATITRKGKTWKSTRFFDLVRVTITMGGKSKAVDINNKRSHAHNPDRD
jgi:hypothetical protein